MEKKKNLTIYDKPISKGKTEVSLSAFSFLFCEIVQYSQTRSNETSDFEQRLKDLGYSVGVRILDLMAVREKNYKRETRLVAFINFIQTQIWRVLFGRPADGFQKTPDIDNEYMIIDYQPLVCKFISLPKDRNVNCASFIAGIVQGVLDSADFSTESVGAYFVQTEGQTNTQYNNNNTAIVIKFKPEVIERDRRV
eukprot:TRINITY_DN5346_c0_g1_i1.p1 TRINITY_DN5346_c0_g1~~TRINITY_DN5346_c0_g1_i1.p1  ORF type:complete len:195 (-),score=77.12 TRINITY_DN5346_c0_g1_i1:90-674(-)